jgi:menaquinone-dependent protoporphyrinogen oxidase
MMNMDKKVLVTYASKHGSTAEIAQKIGEVLRENVLDIEIADVKGVKSIANYGAVVLGSASYYGRWRGDAVKFLKNNAAQLAGMPVWLFMSGPTGKGDPKELLKGVLYPASMQPVIDAVKPREVIAFHGNSSADNFSGWEKWILRRVGSDAADFRDWDMITAWARGIAEELKKI